MKKLILSMFVISAGTAFAGTASNLSKNEDYQQSSYINKGDDWACSDYHMFLTGISLQLMPYGLCHVNKNIDLDVSNIIKVNNEQYVTDDWAPHWLKVQCPKGYMATGYAGNGNYVSCTKSKTQLSDKPCRTLWFNTSNNGYVSHPPIGLNGNWSYNPDRGSADAYKGEVSDNEYISGIASYSSLFKRRDIEVIYACPIM